MHPVLILAIAIAIVLVSILRFRLHAFLALTLAALVVALLTPQRAVERYEIEKNAIRVSAIGSAMPYLNMGSGQGAYVGMRLPVMRANSQTGAMEQVGEAGLVAGQDRLAGHEQTVFERASRDLCR